MIKQNFLGGPTTANQSAQAAASTGGGNSSALVSPVGILQPALPASLSQAMQYVTIALPAAVPVTLNYTGDYLFIDLFLTGSSTTPLDVVDLVTAKSDTTNNAVLLRYPKQGTQWPQAFNNLQITNGSGGPLTLKGWIGFGQIVTQELSSDLQASGPLLRLGASEITRPANVTPYTIGDAVNGNGLTTAIDISDLFVNSDGVARGTVVSAQIIKSSNTTTNAAFRAYLLNVDASGIVDNAAFDFDYATYKLAIIGVIDFPTFVTGPGAGSAAVCSVGDFRIPFVGETTEKIYVVLVALAAYVPASAEKFYLQLQAENAAYANP